MQVSVGVPNDARYEVSECSLPPGNQGSFLAGQPASAPDRVISIRKGQTQTCTAGFVGAACEAAVAGRGVTECFT